MRLVPFLVLVLINCKEPINLDSEGSLGQLVVNGRISTDPGPYILKLGYTVGISQKPNPAPGAQVILFDDAGNSEAYIETKEGEYVLYGAIIQGTPGRSYHVEITLPNDEKYISTPDKIPDATGTDTPYYDFGTRSEFIADTEVKRNTVNVYVNSVLPEGTAPRYFRWDVSETYMFQQTPIPSPLTGGIPPPCYVDGIPDQQRISLHTTKNNTHREINGTLVAVRDIDFTFLARHYFSIRMHSITLESYIYWKNVDQLINRSGSIFDTPPAPIKGNVSNVSDEKENVFGYFEAVNTSVSRFYVLRGDFPGTIQEYCNGPNGIYWYGYPKECSYCLLLDNSSHDFPDWWH